MKSAKKPANETERMEALRSYEILDTRPEKDFDDLTLLASQICQTPIALITLIDDDRQWFKSQFGIAALETSREVAFCSHAILEDKVMVVPNSTLDERFIDNPFVTDDPKVRFYAGAPLTTPCGHKLGTLCVIDSKPRQASPEQIKALESLARQVVTQMELRRSLRELKKSQGTLQEAKDFAESAYKVKSEFLANMSHEIRTPMNGIMGLTELLQNSKLNEDQREKLRMIQSCGQTLLDLINEILDFSKLEAGKVQIEKRDFNFKDLLIDTLKICDVMAVKKALKLYHNIDATTPEYIRSDSNRLRQILMNLLSNAVKFTNVGEISLHVKLLGPVISNSAEIQVSVKDTGLGIPIDLQHRLFKTFSQVDASTTRLYGGTGLGLAICKGLCEKMGGKIWFETVPNRGSTFHFTFKADLCAAKNIFQKKNAEMEVTMIPSSLKVLVAEDNRINQTVIHGLLTQLGHEVDITNDGIEALEKLERKSYDVVFLDCNMPRLDGFETTRSILKDQTRYGRPKIVALTASALEEDKNKCMDCGMDEFLSKPVRSTEIKRILAPIQKNLMTKVHSAPNPTVKSAAAEVIPLTLSNEINLQNFYKGFAAIEHIMGTVIKQFLQDYPVMLQQMNVAIQSKNAKALHVSSHSLKGMLAEIFAEECNKLAYELEQMGKKDKMENAEKVYQTLSQKLNKVEHELKQIKSIPKSA